MNWYAWARGVISGAVGWLIAELVAKMTGFDLPILALAILIFVLGTISIFLEQIAKWIVVQYENKKLRFTIGGVLLLGFIIWLGMPWPRPQSLFETVKLKQPVVDNLWMSESDAENFITDQVRTDGKYEVYPWRVRRLLVALCRNQNIGEFRPKGDSTWRHLSEGTLQAAGILNIPNYDGSVQLSRFIDCDVKYSTEIIRRLNWVAIDTSGYILAPNPDR